MNFIDKSQVFIRAGKGGDGKLSFRQEKFVDKGGPDGGDGGNGGNVILTASRNQNTLAAFRYQKELLAESGQPGGTNKKHGRGGKDLVVAVPVGTTVTDAATGEQLADLTDDGQEAVIARGGKGGFGNAHFISSRRQTPRFAEKGEAGEELEATLELKMIADVGLVGLPNAGKSTLLSRISNAHPEIADYPFTTLKPHLGVVDIDKSSSLLFADIPGLIEGAAEGKGLGHEFLKHIERTAVLVHLIDAYQDDVAQAYQTVQQELKNYSEELANRPQIVVLNKTDGLDGEIVRDLYKQLSSAVPAGVPIQTISAVSGDGIKELLYAVQKLVAAHKEAEAAVIKQKEEALPVLRLEDADKAAWEVRPVEDGFLVTGVRIEQFASRTDFKSEEGVQRLRDILGKMGIMHALLRQGIEPGQTIHIGGTHQLTY